MDDKISPKKMGLGDFDPGLALIALSFPTVGCVPFLIGQAFFKSHGEPLFSSHMLDLSEVGKKVGWGDFEVGRMRWILKIQ